MQDLQNTLDGLAQEFEALAKTINPVLSPSNPETSGGRPYPAVTSPLAERLSLMNQQAHSLREYIVSVHSRVRL